MYYCKTGEKVNTYEEYLKTKHWKKFKIRKIQSIKKNKGKIECECCGNNKRKRHLHHITYQRIGREHLKDVVLICYVCHKETHLLIDQMVSNGIDRKTAIKRAHKLIMKSHGK